MGNSPIHRLAIPLEEDVQVCNLGNITTFSYQGWRNNMEDEIRVDGNMAGVFDGHCGLTAVKFVKNSLFEELNVQETYRDAFIQTERLLKQKINEDWEDTRKEVDVKEGELRVRLPKHVDSSGTCALVAVINDLFVTLVGVGDCTGLRVMKNGMYQVVNTRHRIIEGEEAKNTKEVQRVEKAGLFIENDRVNGELEVTRSIGDFKYKGNQESEELQAVTCIPDINSFEIGNDDKYLLLFSDGISDGIQNYEIAEKICQYESKESMIAALKGLIIMSAHESMDNCSMILIETDIIWNHWSFLHS